MLLGIAQSLKSTGSHVNTLSITKLVPHAGNCFPFIPPKPGKTKSPPGAVLAGATHGCHEPRGSAQLTWAYGSLEIGDLQTCPLQWVPLLLSLPSSAGSNHSAEHSPSHGFPFFTNCNICRLFFGQEKLKKADLERPEVSGGLTGVYWVHTALSSHSVPTLRHTAG